MMGSMRKVILIVLFLLFVACTPVSPNPKKDNHLFKVALLLEGSSFDQGWDSQAYSALIEIEKDMNATVKCVENVNTEAKIQQETNQLAKDGYQLIFGNGRIFEKTFNELAPSYPDAHFVFFNGQPKGENVTSVNFVPESLGYFSGMTAGLMTKNHKIGLIPALSSMKEISAFIAGAKDQNPQNTVYIKEVNDWNDKQIATDIANNMIKNGVDVLVPMGDGYCIDVIMAASKAHIYAIGYVSDQSYIDQKTVITSTVQELNKSYMNIAQKYKNNTLSSGCVYVDFNDGSQRLSSFGPMVTEEVKQKVEKKVKEYNEGTFHLPVKVEKR